MNIDVLASSSKGNAYRITGEGGSLLLECGIPFAEIRRGLNYKASELCGCLLSHEHGDHAKGAEAVLKAGIDVYCSAGTVEALGLQGHRLHVVRAKERLTAGGWSILPFDTVHDAAEPLGFVLTSGEEKVLFATDTAYVRYRFTGLTRILIECNYDLAILKANVVAGLVDHEVKRRVLHSHMSLDTVKGFLRANDLGLVREIVLLHLSEDNSDAAKFKREVQALTGRVVRIA